MLFNSVEFLFFAVIFFSLWPFVRKKDNLRWLTITFFSLLFYGWWDWRFLFLLLGSGLVDYFCGRWMAAQPGRKKIALFLSIVLNLGTLSIFKYSLFFASVLQDGFSFFNLNVDLVGRIPEFALILPVGISFYTFQSLSYTIDVYRGRLEPSRNILHFFSFLSMFPQIVAGPIVRAKVMLKQLKKYRVPTAIEKWDAAKLIGFGFFQKVVIADNLSYFIDSAYEGKTVYDGGIYWWIVAIAFSFQIYADFSGYSSIARGLAKLMGYHFRMNFNHPYLAQSLKEFWNRWHISLSSWFRDYVYIPLGGSRKGRTKGIIILTITMALSGLWHGANYTFLAWALIHTLFLLIERYTKWNKKLGNRAYLLIPVVFLQVTVARVYFRAESMDQANEIIYKLFAFRDMSLEFVSLYFTSILFLLIAILIEYTIYLRRKYVRLALFYKRNHLDILFLGIAIVCVLFFRGEGKQFIYFQF